MFKHIVKQTLRQLRLLDVVKSVMDKVKLTISVLLKGRIFPSVYWKKYESKKMFGSSSRQYWSEYSKIYDREKRSVKIPEIRTLLSFIKGKNPESILEIGCGNGLILKSLNEQMSFDLIAGIDFVKSMISKAQRYINNGTVKLICCDAAELPFDDNTFDIVFSARSLVYVPLKRIGLSRKEMIRVSKKYLITLERRREDLEVNEQYENVANCVRFNYDHATDFQKLGCHILEKEVFSDATKGELELILLEVSNKLGKDF